MQRRGLGRIMGVAALLGLMSTGARAEMIMFGDTGSIFGGSSWTITPDDHVRYDAYQIEGGLSDHAQWTWDNRDAKAGHITFVMPGAYETASAIVTAGVGGGAQSAAVTEVICNDAGFLTVQVEMAALAYAASLDNCLGRGDAGSAAGRAAYAALDAMTDEIVTTLGLDQLK
jgi:hypothetical protein